MALSNVHWPRDAGGERDPHGGCHVCKPWLSGRLTSSGLVVLALLGTQAGYKSCPDFRGLMFDPDIPTPSDRKPKRTPGFLSMCLLLFLSWNS